MKTKSKTSGHIIRSTAYAVLLSVALIALSSAFNSPNAWDESASAPGAYDRMAKSPSQPRLFSFAEHVLFQRAIEDVYWRHRIWPKENPARIDVGDLLTTSPTAIGSPMAALTTAAAHSLGRSLGYSLGYASSGVVEVASDNSLGTR